MAESSAWRPAAAEPEERAAKRHKRGGRNMGALMDGLPAWAQEYAHVTNTMPLDEMKLRLKDVDRLGQTLRRLIQEKSKAKAELEASSGSGLVDACSAGVKPEIKEE